MIDISAWINKFLQELKNTFADRVWFVGLQGSYGRDEATDTSDIDVVVILDEFSAEDIKAYNKMLNKLPHRELICGFISGKREIFSWDMSDLFQFYYDTKAIVGSLDELKPLLNGDAVDRAIKIGACNIYHACVHNMLHEKSDDILRGLYKSASFVVQAIVFRQTGKYIKHQKELLSVADPDEQTIVNTFLYLKNGVPVEFGTMSDVLLVWAKKWITEDN